MNELWKTLQQQCRALATAVINSELEPDNRTFRVVVTPNSADPETLMVTLKVNAETETLYSGVAWGTETPEVFEFLKRKGEINCLTWDDVQCEIDIIEYERAQEVA